MKNTENNISQVNFRREIAQNYLVKYGVPPRGARRPSFYSESSRVFPDLRYDQQGHFVELVSIKRNDAAPVIVVKRKSVGRTLVLDWTLRVLFCKFSCPLTHNFF